MANSTGSPVITICLLTGSTEGSETNGLEQMDKKEVTTDNPVVTDGISVIPVVQVSLSYWRGNNGDLFLAVKQPQAVILISTSAKRAFRITGEEVSIEQLKQEFPNVNV